MGLARLLMGLALGRRLPTVRGSIAADGLDGKVAVRRDRWGIAYVTASTDRDAWLGLGFCHAQDRAFQLETLRRLATGTLSEIVGARGLPADRLARRLGFLRLARGHLDALDAEVMAALDAYSRGIGLGLERGGGRAHEFALLRTRPRPWEVVEALAVAKLLAFAMSGNWDAELARLRVLTEDGPEALAAVDPEYAAWHPAAAPVGSVAGEQVDRLSGDVAALLGALGLSGGSNAWALSPDRTATERPILASDPHLPPRLPPAWYLARLEAGDWAMAGATFVGVPVVAVGHNGAVAWGITLGLSDVSDLYVEDASRPGSGQIETVREEIAVRGRPPVIEEVVITPRGPVIAPPLDGGGLSISMRATWMEPRPIGGLLQAHRARTCDDLRRSFGTWPLMPLGVVFADSAGSVGWQLAGNVPVRRSGHGVVSSAGWTGAGEWCPDPVPYERMPGVADPPAGFVVSANHRPAPEGPGPFLGVDWADGLRAARIAERLAEWREWDIESTARLQLDELSVQWREVRDAVLAIRPLDAASSRALVLLERWDGTVGPDSAAAAVFEVLMARIDALDVADHAPRAGRFILGADISGLGVPNLLAFRRAGRLSRLLRDGGPGRPPDQWERLLSRALAGAVRELTERMGPDSDRWAWGAARPLVLEHPVGRIGPLGDVFNVGPIPFGGDTNTVSQAAVSTLDPLSPPMVVASLRCVIDVGEFGCSVYSMPGGQSGNPLSPHYRDLLGPWLAGEGVPIAWSGGQVERAAVSSITLLPSSGPRAESRETP